MESATEAEFLDLSSVIISECRTYTEIFHNYIGDLMLPITKGRFRHKFLAFNICYLIKYVEESQTTHLPYFIYTYQIRNSCRVNNLTLIPFEGTQAKKAQTFTFFLLIGKQMCKQAC